MPEIEPSIASACAVSPSCNYPEFCYGAGSVFAHLALVALMIWAGICPAAASVTISGRTVNALTGEPLSGAGVSLYYEGGVPPPDPDSSLLYAAELPGGEVIEPLTGHDILGPAANRPLDTAATGVDGSFKLRAPTPGAYRVVLSSLSEDVEGADGFKATSQAVDVTASGAANVEIRADLPPALTLTVCQSDGTPFKGTIECWIWHIKPAGGITYLQLHSGADGLLSIPAPKLPDPAEKSVVDIQADDAGIGSITVTDWTAPGLKVILQPGGTILAAASDRNGAIMANAQVHGIRLLNGGLAIVSGELHTTAGQDGIYKLSNLFPGEYLIETNFPQTEGLFWIARLQPGPGRLATLQPVSTAAITFFQPTVPLMTIMDRLGITPRNSPMVQVKVLRGSTPVTGVVVGLRSGSQLDEQTPSDVADDARTSSQGVAILRAPGPGTYLVGLMEPFTSPPDFQGTQVQIGAESTVPITIQIPPIPEIRPLDSHGKPLVLPVATRVEAHVMALFVDGTAAEWSTSPILLTPGRLSNLFLNERADPFHIKMAIIELEIPGRGTGVLHLNPWDDATHDVVMTPGQVLNGRVLDNTGKPVGPGTVELWRVTEEGLPLFIGGGTDVPTDRNGQFKASSLVPGRYLIRSSEARRNKGWTGWLVHTGAGSLTLTPAQSNAKAAWALHRVQMKGVALAAEIERQLTPHFNAAWPQISGRVVDAGTGTPLAQALVQLTPVDGVEDPLRTDCPAVFTDARGAFLLRSKMPGRRNLTVWLDGFTTLVQPVRAAIAAAPLARTAVALRLHRQTGAWIRLLKPDGRPVPSGAKVMLSASIPIGQGTDNTLTLPIGPKGIVEIKRAGDTDAGSYLNDGSPILSPSSSRYYARYDEGPFILVAAVPGIGASIIDFKAWPRGIVTLHLGIAREISGVVLDSHGRPQDQSDLKLERHHNQEDLTVNCSTGPNGRFLFPLLPPGGYSLQIKDVQVGVKISSRSVNVVITPFTRGPGSWHGPSGQARIPASQKQHTLRTNDSKSMRITGQVLGTASHRPLPGTLALLYGSDTPLACAVDTTGKDGRFHLQAPVPGSYKIGIARDARVECFIPTNETDNQQPSALSPRQDARRYSDAILKHQPIHYWIFGWILRNTRARVRDRENLRFHRARLVGRVRSIFLELGQRYYAMDLLEDPRDILYLEIQEALGFIDGTVTCPDLKAMAAVRKKQYQLFEEMPPSDDRFETYGSPYAGQVPCSTAPDTSQEKAGHLKTGIGCCPGVVRGIVRMVHDPRSTTVRAGEILAAKQTDPGWVLLFPAAAGLLIERGGLLSHSVSIAREMGIPTIASIPGLLTWLKDGDQIEMDGATGRVRQLRISGV